MKGVKNMRKAITSVSIDEKLKRFLRIISVKTRISVSQLIELIINDFCEIDKEKIFVQFTEKYLSIINAYYILNLKGKKAQEFQRTLAKLIDEGKIHTKNILGDFKKFKNYNAYLLFSNLLENNLEVKEKLNNYHHIDFKGSLGEYMYKSKILFIKEKIVSEKSKLEKRESMKKLVEVEEWLL